MATLDETEHQQVVGFLGTPDAYLNPTEPHNSVPETVRSIGMFGGSGGSYWDDGTHTGIKQIKLVYGSAIDSIVVEYEDDGVSSWAAQHGGNGGTTTHTIMLDHPSEFLVSLSGYHCTVNGSLVVVSLTFQTNKRSIGPYGPTNGIYFSMPSFDGKIVGFFGKSGSYLDSLGAHMMIRADAMQSAGTFGGPGGNYWDDGTHSAIKQIKLVYSSSAIYSITIEYDDNGISTWSAQHGDNRGGTTTTITLDLPNEFLVWISGYHSTLHNVPILVSLTFESNVRTFGPYGLKYGTYFYLPQHRGKIVGFFGKSGTYLDSIGAHIEPVKTIQSVGSYGGSYGIRWDDGKHCGIKQMILQYASAIYSITTEYDDNGVSNWSSKHGGNNVSTITITLDHPNEFLVSLSGYYSIFDSLLVLVSLTFQTNKRTFGPYGPKSGTYFSFPPFGGKIVGFFGGSGWYVHSIGAYIMPIETIQSTGPFGGSEGKYWDDGVYSGIKQIKIGYASAIDALTIQYDQNGISYWSGRHGGPGGSTHTITLDHPHEFLEFLSGYYSIFNGVLIIASLTFRSNKRTYGPYGLQKGTYFSFPSSKGKIVGLFGKSGTYLHSIGAHVKLISTSFEEKGGKTLA